MLLLLSKIVKVIIVEFEKILTAVLLFRALAFDFF